MPADKLEKAHKNARMIVLLMIALITFGIFIKYVVDEKNHNRYINSLIATLYSQQKSSGFIVVSGDRTSRETQMILELLKVYGLTPSLEKHDNIPGTAVILSQDINVPTDVLRKAFQRMRIIDFHPGYDKHVPVLYGTNDSTVAHRIHDLMTSLGKDFLYIDLRGDDPAVDGIRARLYLSGYLPFEEISKEIKGPYLEYQGRVYPYPDMVPVIKTFK